MFEVLLKHSFSFYLLQLFGSNHDAYSNANANSSTSNAHMSH